MSCVDENDFLMSEVRGDWLAKIEKETITQITTCYNQDMWDTISVHITR